MKRIYTRLLIAFFAFSMVCSPVFAINVTETPKEGAPDAKTVNAAMESFKSLSKKEKRAKLKQVKKSIRDFKAAKKAGAEPSTNTLLLVILAILLPPLAVYLHEGTLNSRFWLSLILTLLFWLPGVIYALIVVLG
jgi:uncharacterized membrane protein YqaE (UPF0057 family)